MSRGTRFLLLILAALLICLLLGGCWDRKEINDLALVTGVAIDQHGDKNVEITIQIFIPLGSTQGSDSLGKATSGTGTTFIQSASGENIADALSHLQMKFSREIFWGHSEVYIFGVDRVKKGISKDMDFLMRDSEPRERAFVFVSKGKAKKILEKHSILERNTSEVLREMANNRASITTTLAHLQEMLDNESKTALLPWVEPMHAPSEPDPTKGVGYISGTVILHNEKLAGIASNEDTRGLLWTIDEMHNATITIEPESSDGTLSVQLLRSRTRLVPAIKNGEWSVTIHVKCKNQLIQNESDININQSSESLQAIEEQLERSIEQRILQTFEDAKTKYKADIFNFAGAFHRKYPGIWKKHQKDWEEIFPKIKVAVKVEAEILRPGMFNTQQSG
ncbi:hypothetical protein A7K91_22180 [Paenibacillus oryzae]|uniref:Uncharacterized protein n=1 Tax=Paenibacillus oryzae TaxID=1844972 RepID=A0A1A5YPR6_9BACL|nr:Ger(x)C family spore germination protein [Paenibacillus oryzae]OBR67594.1 hypothetical protein A7K91_22180 [Paenibacillus oryzae]